MSRGRGTVLTMLAALLLLLPLLTLAPGASAQTCGPAGGADDPIAPDWGAVPPDAVIAVAGGGWGHGAGMSQYGARGAAEMGCPYDVILTTYYRGVTIDPLPMPPTMRVGLLNLAPQGGGGAVAAVTAIDGDVGWNLHSCGDQREVPCPVQPPPLPVGVTWFVRAIRSPDPNFDGGFRITDAGGGVVFEGGDRFSVLDALHEGVDLRIEVPGLIRETRWGFTRFDGVADGDGQLFVVEYVTPGGGFSGMERYLWGLGEMPSSWPFEALKAQAVAGRTYALTRYGTPGREAACRCDVFATVQDQIWSGWVKERDDAAIGGPWKNAVNVTANQVMRMGDRLADALFYSSSGGSSEAAVHVFGRDVPELQAVDDSRWENAGSNRYHRWTAGYSAPDLARRFGLAEFRSISIIARGPSGRPTATGRPDGVRVEGIDGNGAPVEQWYSGEQVRWKLGVRSSRYNIFPR